MNTQNIHRQTGFSLTEALVAFAVITGGLLAVASFQAGLFNNSAYNKARTEALGLAQQKIEELRHYPFAEKDNFIDENGDGVMETADLVWYNLHYPDERGLAAPVKSLLKKLSKTYGAHRTLYQAGS